MTMVTTRPSDVYHMLTMLHDIEMSIKLALLVFGASRFEFPALVYMSPVGLNIFIPIYTCELYIGLIAYVYWRYRSSVDHKL
jgi:hypothetical protein